MQAVPVGRFHHHIVRLLEEGRVFDERLVDIADVPRERQLGGFARLVDPYLDRRRPQQVPHVDEPHFDSFAELEPFAIAAWDQIADRIFRVLHRIKRFVRLLPRPLALAVAPLGFEFLDVRRVPQHDFTQVTGRVGRVDLPPEPLLAQQRQVSRMVNVCVGQQHIVDLRRGEPRFRRLDLVPALPHPAVDQDVLSTRLQIMTAPRHLMGCP